MRRRIVIVTAVALCVIVAIAPRDARPETSPSWPQWRGPNRDGISPQTISTWSPVKLWEVNVGYGVSSVIATEGRVVRPRIDHREMERLSRRFIETGVQNMIQGELGHQLDRLFGPPR